MAIANLSLKNYASTDVVFTPIKNTPGTQTIFGDLTAASRLAMRTVTVNYAEDKKGIQRVSTVTDVPVLSADGALDYFVRHSSTCQAPTRAALTVKRDCRSLGLSVAASSAVTAAWETFSMPM